MNQAEFIITLAIALVALIAGAVAYHFYKIRQRKIHMPEELPSKPNTE